MQHLIEAVGTGVSSGFHPAGFPADFKAAWNKEHVLRRNHQIFTKFIGSLSIMEPTYITWQELKLLLSDVIC